MDELIDVVDKSDIVISQELKSVCHDKGLLHRGSAILVFKDSSHKQILLQKRSLLTTSQPGKLCIPGGHLLSGESYHDAAIRELGQELYNDAEKYRGKLFQRLFKIQVGIGNNHEFLTLFKTVDNGDFRPDPKEVHSSFFEPIDKVLKDILVNSSTYTPTTISLLNEYIK